MVQRSGSHRAWPHSCKRCPSLVFLWGVSLLFHTWCALHYEHQSSRSQLWWLVWCRIHRRFLLHNYLKQQLPRHLRIPCNCRHTGLSSRGSTQTCIAGLNNGSRMQDHRNHNYHRLRCGSQHTFLGFCPRGSTHQKLLHLPYIFICPQGYCHNYTLSPFCLWQHGCLLFSRPLGLSCTIYWGQQHWWRKRWRSERKWRRSWLEVSLELSYVKFWLLMGIGKILNL